MNRTALLSEVVGQPMQLQFLGATGTVTGSKYLIKHNGQKVLIDCGIYQGIKQFRQRNWKPLPVDPEQIDAVILTHAHIDHSGYIPALVRNGFKGPIYCTAATRDLCRVLLPDAGFLQEEDARHAARHGYSKHNPPLPLYTEEDARHALKQFKVLKFEERYKVAGLQVYLRPAGHILGAATVELFDGHHMLCFSGDLGRTDDPLLYPPKPLGRADYLVIESTYGDRLHTAEDSLERLATIINRTVSRGGIVLMPAFAVGRAQLILHMLQQLRQQQRIGHIPVFLNSPMAIRSTEIFCQHHSLHRLSAGDCALIDENTHYVRTVEESIALNNRRYPCIIISASGMASGGRVLHHLKSLAPNHRNSIVFLGFQAPGTRGEAMINGTKTIKLHGMMVPVRASIHHLDNLSAHADYKGMIDWLRKIPTPPKQLFITHGEPAAAAALQNHIQEQLGWSSYIPELDELVEIGGQSYANSA